jgi:hypothetical protein
MKMPKMEKGKTAENGNWRRRQKCRNQIYVLVKNAENCFFYTTFEAIVIKERVLN